MICMLFSHDQDRKHTILFDIQVSSKFAHIFKRIYIILCYKTRGILRVHKNVYLLTLTSLSRHIIILQIEYVFIFIYHLYEKQTCLNDTCHNNSHISMYIPHQSLFINLYFI